MGALLFQSGDFAGSLSELQQARTLKPSLPNLDGLIAMSNAELGHYNISVAPLEQTFHAATENVLALPSISNGNASVLIRITGSELLGSALAETNVTDRE